MLAATIAAWGLPAVFLGSGLEGEATVICGGVLAQHRVFSLPTVIACASTGSFSVDQSLFLVGRYLGQKPRLRALLDRPLPTRRSIWSSAARSASCWPSASFMACAC
jgi:membrane protein DedA with SNARE-associated domain